MNELQIFIFLTFLERSWSFGVVLYEIITLGKFANVFYYTL